MGNSPISCLSPSSDKNVTYNIYTPNEKVVGESGSSEKKDLLKESPKKNEDVNQCERP